MNLESFTHILMNETNGTISMQEAAKNMYSHIAHDLMTEDHKPCYIKAQEMQEEINNA